MIHLEPATYENIVESDLIHSTALCFQWNKLFLFKRNRDQAAQGYNMADELVQEVRMGSPGDNYILKCPTCDSRFPKVFSMFMHVESPACGAKLGEGAVGKLQTWLVKRHEP